MQSVLSTNITVLKESTFNREQYRDRPASDTLTDLPLCMYFNSISENITSDWLVENIPDKARGPAVVCTENDRH